MGVSTGIYITDKSIRVAQKLLGEQGAVEYKEYCFDISSLNREEAISRLKKFIEENQIATDEVSLAIPRNKVIIKSLNVPSTDAGEIKSIVGLKSKDLFPYRVDELIIDQAVMGVSPDGYSQVMIAAILKTNLREQLSLLEGAGIIPGEGFLSSLSLYNQVLSGGVGNALVVNLEDDFLDIVVIENGKFNFSRGIHLQRADPQKQLIDELNQTVYLKKTEGLVFEKLILGGRGRDLNALAERLKSVFEVNIEVDNELSVSRSLVASGLKEQLSINLLPLEFKARKRKANRKTALLFFGALLLLNLSLIANIAYLKVREKRDYLKFLQSQIEVIKKESISLQEKKEKLDIFKKYAASGVRALEVLTELHRLAPKDISLNTLEIKEIGTVVLVGSTKSNESVLQFSSLINESEFFKRAEVQHITKKGSGEKEVIEFEIKCSY